RWFEEILLSRFGCGCCGLGCAGLDNTTVRSQVSFASIRGLRCGAHRVATSVGEWRSSELGGAHNAALHQASIALRARIALICARLELTRAVKMRTSSPRASILFA